VEKYRQKVKPGLKHKNESYAAMVQSLDESVGRILETLDKQGIADRTVVIFTSDNGGVVNQVRGRVPTDNSPLRSGKGSLYEGGIRVPWIAYWPGVTQAGAVSGEPISSQDLYPTILEIAGADDRAAWNQPIDGFSLVPLFRDSAAKLDRETLYWHFPHYYPTTTPVSALRAGDWKLVEYFEDGHAELYNLRDDLGEMRDLSQNEPARTAELRERLRAWREAVHAGVPTRNVGRKAK